MSLILRKSHTLILLVSAFIIGALLYAGFKDKNYEIPLLETGLPVGFVSYANPAFGFSVAYPESFSINEGHVYNAFGPGKEIYGVSFTIPKSFSSGTNLSSDTYVSVETLPGINGCRASAFLDRAESSSTVSENDFEYDVAEARGAAAGNIYEEIIYAIPNSKPCMAIRYFIHSTNIRNYDPGTVKEFNQDKLLGLFDQIRRTYKGVE